LNQLSAQDVIRCKVEVISARLFLAMSDAVQEGSIKELRSCANWIYIHEASGGPSPKEG